MLSYNLDKGNFGGFKEENESIEKKSEYFIDSVNNEIV